MFRMIYWIFTSPDGQIKVPYNRFLYVEVHCALIAYENRKAKPSRYLVQILISMIPMIDDKNGFQSDEN